MKQNKIKKKGDKKAKKLGLNRSPQNKEGTGKRLSKKHETAKTKIDSVENLLIIKSISRDLKKISESYNLEKKSANTPEKKHKLEEKKKDIYKLTYLIYKVSNKILGELE